MGHTGSRARAFALVFVLAAAGCSGDDSSPPAGAAGAGGTAGAGGDGGSAGIGGQDDAGPDGAVEAGDSGLDASTACPVSVTPAPGLVVTDLGAVQGTKSGATWAYRGIPYAAPPLDDLRWKAPEPHACFDGVLAASAFGPKCPQVDEKTDSFVGEEDCLQLNVWAPDSSASSVPLPVLFFIHGGGNIQGSSSEDIVAGKPIYDGRRLAEGGPVVVVTVNYRLGPLGFLALPELAGESAEGVSGNYGILDQIAALQWVKRNIGAFGGDPARVTIFGESAGAVDTCVQLASPLSAGLFQGALMESGGCTAPAYDAVEAAMSARVTTDSSCSGDADRLGCLRGQTAEQLIGEIPGSIGVFSTNLGGALTDYGPVVDGWVLKKSPLDALTDGSHSHVPFVVGTNREEMAGRLTTTVDTVAAYEAEVHTMFGALGATVPDTILAAYPAADYPTAQDALIALLSDMRFTCPARRIVQAAASSQQEPVYRYFFTRQAALANGTSKPSSHGIELLYVFGTLHDVPLYTPAAADATLSTDVIGYWTRFATAGDPNGNGAVAWPRYDVAKDDHLVLDSPIMASEGVRTAQCDMWDALMASLGN